MKKVLLFPAVLLSLLLQACVPLIITSVAATTAVIVINDHRSSPTQHADKQLEKAITATLNASPGIEKNSHIVVSVFNREALLVGQTPTQRLKDKAGSIAGSIEGIKKLYNELSISAPNSHLSRASDYWITTKINTLLLGKKSLKSAQIQVLTDNGVVYLMGNATRSQIATIMSKVRSVSGVEKIVDVMNGPVS